LGKESSQKLLLRGTRKREKGKERKEKRKRNKEKGIKKKEEKYTGYFHYECSCTFLGLSNYFSKTINMLNLLVFSIKSC
jgi:hypothetical protein